MISEIITNNPNDSIKFLSFFVISVLLIYFLYFLYKSAKSSGRGFSDFDDRQTLILAVVYILLILLSVPLIYIFKYQYNYVMYYIDILKNSIILNPWEAWSLFAIVVISIYTIIVKAVKTITNSSPFDTFYDIIDMAAKIFLLLALIGILINVNKFLLNAANINGLLNFQPNLKGLIYVSTLIFMILAFSYLLVKEPLTRMNLILRDYLPTTDMKKLHIMRVHVRFIVFFLSLLLTFKLLNTQYTILIEMIDSNGYFSMLLAVPILMIVFYLRHVGVIQKKPSYRKQFEKINGSDMVAMESLANEEVSEILLALLFMFIFSYTLALIFGCIGLYV